MTKAKDQKKAKAPRKLKLEKATVKDLTPGQGATAVKGGHGTTSRWC